MQSSKRTLEKLVIKHGISKINNAFLHGMPIHKNSKKTA